MENTLQIRHHSDSNGFQVIRSRDGKATFHSAQIPAPAAFAVVSRRNSKHSRELRWYVEQFLDYSFPPDKSIRDLGITLKRQDETERALDLLTRAYDLK